MVTTSSSYQHFQQTDALSRSKQSERQAKKKSKNSKAASSAAKKGNSKLTRTK